MDTENLEEFKCPICFEIFQKEIFQCLNGHTICGECSKNLSECPQCRVPFETIKIRNRALESLIKTVSDYNRPKRVFLPRKLTQPSWYGTRKYSFSSSNFTINFCKHLGYKCEFMTNTSNLAEALVHFEKCHDFIVNQKINIDINLEGFPNFNQTKRSWWTPIILNLDSKFKKLVVILSTFNHEDKSISIIPVELTNDSQEACSSIVRIEFTIIPLEPIKTPKIEWSTSPITLHQTEIALQCPAFRIPVALLSQNFAKDGSLVINCTVACLKNVGKKRVAEQIFIFNGLNNSQDKSMTLVPVVTSAKQLFKNTTCNVCETSPIPIRYKCLQCADYDLCELCMQLEEHRHHLFAIVYNNKQQEWLKGRLRTPSGWQPFFLGPLSLNASDWNLDTVISCRMTKCQNFYSYICLQCPPAYGFCDACFTKYSGSHFEDHIFAVANTERKIRLVSENLLKIDSKRSA